MFLTERDAKARFTEIKSGSSVLLRDMLTSAAQDRQRKASATSDKRKAGFPPIETPHAKRQANDTNGIGLSGGAGGRAGGPNNNGSAAAVSVERIRGMSRDELASVCADCGLPQLGSRVQLMERVIASLGGIGVRR